MVSPVGQFFVYCYYHRCHNPYNRVQYAYNKTDSDCKSCQYEYERLIFSLEHAEQVPSEDNIVRSQQTKVQITPLRHTSSLCPHHDTKQKSAWKAKTVIGWHLAYAGKRLIIVVTIKHISEAAICADNRHLAEGGQGGVLSRCVQDEQGLCISTKDLSGAWRVWAHLTFSQGTCECPLPPEPYPPTPPNLVCPPIKHPHRAPPALTHLTCLPTIQPPPPCPKPSHR